MSGRLTLLFVGDVMIGRRVNNVLHRVPADYPWGDTIELFRQTDWRACNLECVISDHGRPWNATPKMFHFRSEAKNIACLKAAGIDAVSIANNHTLDFDYEAMAEMIRLLARARIQHAGAGANLVQAAMPAICSVAAANADIAARTTVRMIAFTDNQPEWEARADLPGVFYVPLDLTDGRAQALLEQVRTMSRTTGLTIVSAHWGPNWGYRPTPGHERFAHALIDVGADVIFGHSGHVFQGIEIYRQRPIFYCTGNFIDDYAVDETERNDESFIFVAEFEGRRIAGIRLYPTEIAECHARRVHGARAEQIAFKMVGLCKDFGTKTHWLADEEVLEIAAA